MILEPLQGRSCMTREDLKKISQRGDIIIYGAHTVAKGLYAILSRMGAAANVTAFAVTDMRGNPDEISGVRVRPIRELTAQSETCTVIMALPEKFFSEVAGTLDGYGFLSYAKFGLADCMRLLNQDAIVHINGSDAMVSAAESPYDYGALDLFPGKLPEEAGSERVVEADHCKLGVLTGFPYDDNADRFIREMDFYEAYESACGPYRNLRRLAAGAGSEDADAATIQVYMATSHKDGPIPDSFKIPLWTIPVQGGSALTDRRTGAVCDNEGENISGRNADFAEMTVTYWAWKNAPASRYKGLCHYRRHFVLDDKDIRRITENNIDAVLTPARLVFPNVRDYFLEIPAYRSSDHELLLGILAGKAPEYFADADRFFSGNYQYPNNMVIARAEVFDNYCEWAFGLLFEMEARVKASGVVREDRYLAYCAELLTSIYFIHNREKLKIAVTDYRFLG